MPCINNTIDTKRRDFLTPIPPIPPMRPIPNGETADKMKVNEGQ